MSKCNWNSMRSTFMSKWCNWRQCCQVDIIEDYLLSPEGMRTALNLLIFCECVIICNQKNWCRSKVIRAAPDSPAMSTWRKKRGAPNSQAMATRSKTKVETVNFFEIWCIIYVWHHFMCMFFYSGTCLCEHQLLVVPFWFEMMWTWYWFCLTDMLFAESLVDS